MKNGKIKEENKKMYLGPSIERYGLINGNIFENELPINIKEAINHYPLIKELFIPIDNNFSNIKKNLNVEGTKENIFFKKILKILKEENKNV